MNKLQPNSEKEGVTWAASTNRCAYSEACLAIVYKENLCKAHYLTILKNRLRKEIAKVYKDPESAYASFNFSGKSCITLDEILDHIIVKRIGYPRDDIKSYLLRDKVF